MAPKRRKNTPKPALKAQNEIEDSHREVPDEVRRILAEMEKQVNERAESILGLAAEMTQSLRCVLQIQLLKLPKQVREMPLKDFKEKFGGDINSVLLSDMEERLQASIAAAGPATSLKTRATQAKPNGHHLMETPAFNSQGSTRQATTVMRAPKLGETFYSMNGSPIGVLEAKPGQKGGLLRTVLKGGLCTETPMMLQGPARGFATSVLHRERPGSKTGVADGIVITLKDGKQVTVDFDGGLEAVPSEHRQEAAVHLEALEKLARCALSSQSSQQ